MDPEKLEKPVKQSQTQRSGHDHFGRPAFILKRMGHGKINNRQRQNNDKGFTQAAGKTEQAFEPGHREKRGQYRSNQYRSNRRVNGVRTPHKPSGDNHVKQPKYQYRAGQAAKKYLLIKLKNTRRPRQEEKR